MQYACYKTHPTAKMIKEASPFCTVWTVEWAIQKRAVEYIERDCAEMFKEVDYHSELIDGEVEVVDWFQQVTDRYADCSDEYRDNLIIYCNMIGEVDDYIDNARLANCLSDYWEAARERAWGLYKIISDCPTSVY
tara:strand:+ start:110 stop:514 length:405 start_codon:yes stop_codon:yes gene_type:complete